MTMKFSDLLAHYRVELDLTQNALARRIGAPFSTIYRLENNERQPSREMVARLCDALGLSAVACATLHAHAGYTTPDGIGRENPRPHRRKLPVSLARVAVRQDRLTPTRR